MNKEYKGVNGTLIINDTGIVIHRGAKGAIFGTASQRGDKSISYNMISAVQLQSGGLIQRQGYIRFSFLGGAESKNLTRYGIAKDENSILFATSKNKEFEEAKQLVESRMGTTPQSNGQSSLDELEKLGKLKEQGLISQEEFDAKKKQLLGL